MSNKNQLYEEIKSRIENTPIIESHDHFSPDPDGQWPQFDLCDLIFHNLNPDMTASGMPGVGSHARTPWDPIIREAEKKWQVISPYMRNIENMASYKALVRGLQAAYDFDDNTINDENWSGLNEQVVAAYQRKEWIDYVLLEKAKIRVAVVDMDTLSTDREYLLPSMKMDFIMMEGSSYDGLKKLESRFDMSLSTFSNLRDIISQTFNEFVKGGAVAIKSVAAYYRTIYYADVSEIEARKIFDKGLQNITDQERVSLQNFIMHEICRLTQESGLPIQFHTGKLGWNFQIIENTNPVHLTVLLKKFPRLRFDLFHGGIPYTNEFGVLANNYPNAYLDINGMQWTSFEISRKCLSEWMEMVPQNKILWGADSYRVFEGTLGQVLYFKEILSQVLAEKVTGGLYELDTAVELAERILYRNAESFFNLNQRKR